MNEQRPPVGTNQPRNRHPATVSSQAVRTLTALRRVVVAPPIKLRPSFPQPKHRTAAQRKIELASFFIDSELLNNAVLRFNPEAERISGNGYRKISAAYRSRLREGSEIRCRLAPVRAHQRAIV